MADPILVLGATGTHGGAVADALLKTGHNVHALVRNPASSRAAALRSRGATLVSGDLEHEESLAEAFAPVGSVYAVTTPFEQGAQEEERQGANIVSAAQAVHLPWLLLASVAAADRAPVPHFVSKAHVEQHLANSGLAWTVIAPSYFYENVLGAREAIEAGSLPMAIPADKPLHQIALRDLGALVVAVISRREEHIGARVAVAGDNPTPADMAAAFGVRYEPVPLDAIRQRSEDLAAMYGFLSDEGYGIDIRAVRARYPEVPWTTFADWAHGIVATGLQ